MTVIECQAFNKCFALQNVYYSGTKKQWKAIHIDDGNEPVLEAKRTYRSAQQSKTDKPDLTMHVKDTVMLTASANVIWGSSNEKVVVVDASGKVTAVGTGTATITATNQTTGEIDSYTILVKYSFVQILIRIFLFGWIWYK